MPAGRPRRVAAVGHAPSLLDAALLTQVETWRRQQPERLSLKTAVERLLLRGLRAERDDETLGMTCPECGGEDIEDITIPVRCRDCGHRGDPDEFLPKEPTRC
jgi:DNA-directed RNA polymerase subunit RPC12/RpoP